MPAKFLKSITFKPGHFSVREALDASKQGVLDIISAKKWENVVFQISAEKSLLAYNKKGPAQLWMTFGVVICKKKHAAKPHSKSVGDYFCQAGKLFSAYIWKITFCDFWADILPRQPRVPFFKKCPGLKEVGFQKYCRLHFIFS